MAPREVTLLQVRLVAIGKAAAGLAGQVEDLHALAHDRAASDGVKVASSGHPVGVENVGDERARDVWRRLQRIPALERELLTLERAAGNLLSEGPSPPATRGSTLSRGEFVALKRKQAARRVAGEYVPKRNEDQPEFPGGRRRS